MVVIAVLRAPSIVLDWHIERVIADSLSLIPASSSWEARKINKSANFCTYHMTYWAMAQVHSGCIPIFFSPPLPPTCSGSKGVVMFSFLVQCLLQKKKKRKKEKKDCPTIINSIIVRKSH